MVAMDFSANITLALGASPLMAHALEELSDIVALADALLVNIGTLDPCFMAAAEDASK